MMVVARSGCCSSVLYDCQLGTGLSYLVDQCVAVQSPSRLVRDYLPGTGLDCPVGHATGTPRVSVDLLVEAIEPGAGLLHVRTGQSDHWINLHHQVPSRARLPGEVGDGIRVVFEPHKGPLPDPRSHVVRLPSCPAMTACAPSSDSGLEQTAAGAGQPAARPRYWPGSANRWPTPARRRPPRPAR
jgi:hypothetical protein